MRDPLAQLKKIKNDEFIELKGIKAVRKGKKRLY